MPQKILDVLLPSGVSSQQYMSIDIKANHHLQPQKNDMLI